MNTFLELQTALMSDLNVSDSSSLYPTATIKLALNRAYIKAGRLFRWPALEDAKKTSTQANIEYYDAPSDWSPDSIWRLEVDGEPYGQSPDYSPLDFHDYLDWKDDDFNEGSTDKKWAVQWLRYFIYPTPTTAGDYNITVWGQKNVETLTDDTDTTIFSSNMPECNEAIVNEASSILKNKGEDANMGELLNKKSLQILAIAYNKLKQEKAKYEKIQPFFEVPDMFGRGNVRQTTGNFE